jgi:hypothetical protein
LPTREPLLKPQAEGAGALQRHQPQSARVDREALIAGLSASGEDKCLPEPLSG